jgi:rhodanese-related sulfurtransferase
MWRPWRVSSTVEPPAGGDADCKLYGSSVARAQRLQAPNRSWRRPELAHPLTGDTEPYDRDGECRSLDGLLRAAAARITRFHAAEAFSACAADGVIIDIRSQDAREVHGVIPGSLHIPRTVLEWRIALDSPWRNVHLGERDQQLILICDHGYSSILAAANLVQLGFCRAGDVIGGFEAWKRNGLPVARCRRRRFTAGALPGSGPPE